MDSGTSVAPRAAVAGGVIDQAIFTSIRSPMARGYRLVACSAGWTEDEKRELVQRAPSHGNLGDPGENARALAGFTLRSGRFCLMRACHAGPEPSGRGGLRVHTHALALAPALYRAFAHDPFRVEEFACESISAGVRNTPSMSMPQLQVPETAAGPRGRTTAVAVAPGLLQTLDVVLRERDTLVTGATNAEDALRTVFRLTPLRIRRNLSFSAGMKSSAQRGFRLLFHAGAPGEAELMILDHQYQNVNWNAPEAAQGPFCAWLSFIAQQLRGGRTAELTALTDELAEECTSNGLALLADLINQRATVDRLDEAGCKTLYHKYEAAEVSGVAERLLSELRDAIDERLEALAPPPEAPEAPAAPSAGNSSAPNT